MLLKLTLAIFLCQWAIAQVTPSGGGGWEAVSQPCLEDHQRKAFRQLVRENSQYLREQGKLSRSKIEQPRFIYPLVNAGLATDQHRWAIVNYVDLNSEYPNQITDFMGGRRTYDLASGYNHKGIDIALFPFAWDKMDREMVHIIAAASGTITARVDGNPDRNCGFVSGQHWNIVIVTHDDGSQAWYGHMKLGSLTAKLVGDRVEAGEFLGVVGSSGQSLGPHVHFEVYDRDGNLIEPFAGPANGLNNMSWWQNQEPYFVSQVNAIYTHASPPSTLVCSSSANFQPINEFSPGQPLFVAAYYRDLRRNQQTNFTITDPQGNIKAAWDFDFLQANFFPISYWYWQFNNTASWEPGIYTVSAFHAGQTVLHYFALGNLSLPAIESFTAKKEVIRPKQSTTLIWQAARAHQVWLEGDLTYRKPQGQLLVSPTQTASYTLNAKGPGGFSSQTVTVIVEGQPEPRVLAHVTPNSNFITDFVLTNTGSVEAEYQFKPFNESGESLPQVTGQLQPGESRFLTKSELFNQHPVSHFQIQAPDEVQVTASYRADAGGSPAHVRDRALSARGWRIFPGDWNWVWDGFAAINIGSETARLSIRHYDGRGQLIGENLDFATVSQNAKQLAVISSMSFTPLIESYFILSADQPVNILVLRGQLGDSRFLFENDAIIETP